MGNELAVSNDEEGVSGGTEMERIQHATKWKKEPEKEIK
jgi:hypothetical protein